MNNPTYDQMVDYLADKETHDAYNKVREKLSCWLTCQNCFMDSKLATNPGFFETLNKKDLEKKYNFVKKAISLMNIP